MYVARMFADRVGRTKDIMTALTRLEYALGRGNAIETYDGLHQLRNSILESKYQSSRFAEQRVAQLEATVDRLTKELESQEPTEELREEQGSQDDAVRNSVLPRIGSL